MRLESLSLEGYRLCFFPITPRAFGFLPAAGGGGSYAKMSAVGSMPQGILPCRATLSGVTGVTFTSGFEVKLEFWVQTGSRDFREGAVAEHLRLQVANIEKTQSRASAFHSEAKFRVQGLGVYWGHIGIIEKNMETTI